MRSVSLSECETREPTNSKVSFTPHTILDTHRFLSYREPTDEDIVKAALITLSESLGSSPTVTTTDLYDHLIGTRGSNAWELAREKNILTPQRIARVLTSHGFVNISKPHRIARYKLAGGISPEDLKESLCFSCQHDKTCDHETGFSNDSGVCGSYENKNTREVAI